LFFICVWFFLIAKSFVEQIKKNFLLPTKSSACKAKDTGSKEGQNLSKPAPDSKNKPKTKIAPLKIIYN
jgi:hypothetical protein